MKPFKITGKKLEWQRKEHEHGTVEWAAQVLGISIWCHIPDDPGAVYKAMWHGDGSRTFRSLDAAKAGAQTALDEYAQKLCGNFDIQLEWQPMEDAPRDGTPVLLRHVDNLAELWPQDGARHAGTQFVGWNRGDACEWGVKGMSGIPDCWLAGWLPLPQTTAPAKDSDDQQLAELLERRQGESSVFVELDDLCHKSESGRESLQTILSARSDEIARVTGLALDEVWHDHIADTGSPPENFTIHGPPSTRVDADFHNTAFVAQVMRHAISLAGALDQAAELLADRPAPEGAEESK